MHTVKITLLVALAVLVEQILARECLVADRAGKFVGVHVQHVVPRQVVQSRILLGTDVTGEFGSIGVTSLMVLQIPLLGERFFAGTANNLVALIPFRIHMTCQFLTRQEFLFAKEAAEFLRLFFPLYILQKVRIGHDFVEEGIF